MIQIEQLTLTTLTENYCDMLLADGEHHRRAGLAHHFDPKRPNPVGENGISLHVDLAWNRYRYQALFDTGLTSAVLLHNATAFDVDVNQLDHVVLSHGHPDHYGGLTGLLEARKAPLPVSAHPDAFLPRYLRLASGEVAPYYNHELTTGSIREGGGMLVSHSGPIEVGPGLIASGAIPRTVDFEQPSEDTAAPNALLQIRDGHSCADSVPDDQMLIVEVGKDGIVVLLGCSHAGVINSVSHAISLTGRDRVRGIIGGFHLGFPGTPEEKTARTIEALSDIEPEILCPMHCTGQAAAARIASAFPRSYLLNCTGTRVFFDGSVA